MLTSLSIDIIPFQDEYQPGIDVLMASIAAEYAESIYSPQFKKLKEIALLPNHRYWVARAGDRVIGTIGLCALENDHVELKRLFLLKEFRGKGVSKILLDTALDSAIESKFACMFLGTMNQFKAAQAFYEKNGFGRIPQSALPADFLINPVDKVFYSKTLK